MKNERKQFKKNIGLGMCLGVALGSLIGIFTKNFAFLDMYWLMFRHSNWLMYRKY